MRWSSMRSNGGYNGIHGTISTSCCGSRFPVVQVFRSKLLFLLLQLPQLIRSNTRIWKVRNCSLAIVRFWGHGLQDGLIGKRDNSQQVLAASCSEDASTNNTKVEMFVRFPINDCVCKSVDTDRWRCALTHPYALQQSMPFESFRVPGE